MNNAFPKIQTNSLKHLGMGPLTQHKIKNAYLWKIHIYCGNYYNHLLDLLSPVVYMVSHHLIFFCPLSIYKVKGCF